MSNAHLEKRVAALEAKVAALSQTASVKPLPWWEAIRGGFANDPLFDEAMRLGREYRESLRPKPLTKPKQKKRSGTKNVSAGHRSR